MRLDFRSTDPTSIQGNSVLATGQWYHVAATWDGAFARIYVNGQLDGSPIARSDTIGTDTRPVYIGGRSGATDFFDGMIYALLLQSRLKRGRRGQAGRSVGALEIRGGNRHFGR